MPPPQLPADAPILNVAHPGEVGVFPLLGYKLDGAGLDRLNGRLREFFRVDIPLRCQPRLNHRARAVASRYFECVWFNFLQQPGRLELSDDLRSGIKTVQSPEALRGLIVYFGLGGQHIDHGQIVTLAHGVVIEVMRGRNLDAAGTELGIHVIIGNDRDAPPSEGQVDGLSYQIAVALIIGVDRNRRIAQHGFGTGRRDDQMTLAATQRVAEMPE